MNSALVNVGAEPIVAETDDSVRARLVAMKFPIVLEAMLAGHPWNFATAYATLAAISPKPADVFDYEFVFQLPADCLRVSDTNLGGYEDWEEIEGRRIACNVSELKIKYIKNVADVSKYSASFVNALSWALTADIAYPLTQSTAQQDSADSRAKLFLATARSFDAQVGSVRRVKSEDWLDARRT